jgi:hypothetical protein
VEIQKKIVGEIEKLAQGKFGQALVDRLIENLHILSADEPVIDFIVMLTGENNEELEVGFFNNENIVDISLSQGEIYFCSYPVDSIKQITIENNGDLTSLKIIGEKKLDYKVIKPGSVALLKSYGQSLRQHIPLTEEARATL